MRLLDLFSGIGGFSLGLERAGFQTVAFCEVAPACRHLLAHHWPGVPCYDDVRTLTAERLAADGVRVDAICGGFPCQDLSRTGKRAGLDGEQSGLWSHFARLIRDLRPTFVFVENVPELLKRGVSVVLGDLAAIGYDAEWEGIPAAAVRAPHMRARQWLVAYPAGFGDRLASGSFQAGWKAALDSAVWLPEPDVGRVADGTAARVDRLHGLGNAVVPQIPELLGRAALKALAA